MLSRSRMRNSPWRHSARLAFVSRCGAVAFLLASIGFGLAGHYWATLVVLTAGAAADAALALVWARLPPMLAWPIGRASMAWTTVGLWQVGVIAVASGLAAGQGSLSLGGAFLLMMAAFLFLEHVGSAVYSSPRRDADPVPLLTVCFALAGLSWVLGALFIALWAHSGGAGIVEFGLGALTFGSFALAGSAGFLQDAPDRPFFT